MPNALRGEYAIEGNGKPLVLVYDYQAICALEEHYQLPMSQIVGKLDGGLEDLAIIFHAGLRARQPDIDMDAAKILLLPYNERRVAVGAAIALAYNGPEALREQSKKKRWWG